MEKNSVCCSVCGGDVSYSVLADAIITQTCPKGCGRGVIVMRGAMTDAINDMDAKKEGEGQCPITDLSINQQDEINARIRFLQEVFHVLFEAMPQKNLTLSNFDALLTDSACKVDEIKAILDGKNIIRRNAETVFGIS